MCEGGKLEINAAAGVTGLYRCSRESEMCILQFACGSVRADARSYCAKLHGWQKQSQKSNQIEDLDKFMKMEYPPPRSDVGSDDGNDNNDGTIGESNLNVPTALLVLWNITVHGDNHDECDCRSIQATS